MATKDKLRYIKLFNEEGENVVDIKFILLTSSEMARLQPVNIIAEEDLNEQFLLAETQLPVEVFETSTYATAGLAYPEKTQMSDFVEKFPSFTNGLFYFHGNVPEREGWMNLDGLSSNNRLYNEDRTRYLNLSTMEVFEVATEEGQDDELIVSSAFNPLADIPFSGIRFNAFPEDILEEDYERLPFADKPLYYTAVYESDTSPFPYKTLYSAFTRDEQQFSAAPFIALIYNQETYEVDSDPFEKNPGNDIKGNIGGGGSWIKRGDKIGLPGLPNFNVNSTGFVTLYSPTDSQLRSFSEWLWSPSVFDTIIKNWASPLDNIISFHLIPASNTQSSGTLFFAGVNTHLNMDILRNQYIEFDFGEIEIPYYSGSYLDYDNSKMSLFLPYIGNVELNPAEILGEWKRTTAKPKLNIHYYIDNFTGAVVAFIRRAERGEAYTIYGTFTGNCMTSLPICSRDMSSVYGAILGMATSGFNAVTGIAKGAVSGGEIGAVSAATGVVSDVAGNAGQLMSAHPSVAKSGNMAGSVGLMNYQQPFITISWPNPITPRHNDKLEGYPDYRRVYLDEVTGLTKILAVDVDKIPNATESEKREIERLLKEGVRL